MKLYEKIMTLRRRNGWSQEELAERLDVSRQSVSKWEMGQSVPELDKIVQMSNLFGVSTDCLIRDELNLEGFVDFSAEAQKSAEEPESEPTGNLLAESDVRLLLKQARLKNLLTAFGVLLCILAPIPMILEQFVIGAIVIPLMIAMAVCCFIFADHLWKNTPYATYTPGDRLAAEAETYLKENRVAATRRFLLFNLFGVVLFILSPFPLILLALLRGDELADWQAEIGVAILLAAVAVGVFLVLLRGKEMALWGRFRMMMENKIPQDVREGEEPQEATERIRNNTQFGLFRKIYWSIITAGYLLVSFLTSRWDYTWIVWPVAGVLFTAAEAIALLVRREKNEKQ